MKSMNLLSERLLWAKQQKEQRDGARVTGVAMATAANVSTAAVTNWLKDQNGIDGKYARPLADFLGVDALWLEAGTGTPEGTFSSTPGNARRVIAHQDDDPNFVEIRRVKLRLSAGITGFNAEPADKDGQPISFRLDWFKKRGYIPEKLVSIDVKGESMEPTMSDGDTVVINTADTAPKDGQIFAVNFDGEAVIKRMVKDYGRWFLVSDNPDQKRYHRQECTAASCIIVGRVVVLQRENM